MPPTVVSHYFLSVISGFLSCWYLDRGFLSYFLDGGFVGGRVTQSLLSSRGLHPVTCYHLGRGFAGVVLPASVHLPSSSRIFLVRILFRVFCWSVPLWQLRTLGRYFLFPARWGPVAGTQKQSLMKMDPLAAHQLAGFWRPIWTPGG